MKRFAPAPVLALGLAIASALAALPAEAANVITPRAWILIYDCGAGLVDLRGDHGYTISQIDSSGAGKLVSVEGKLEKSFFGFPSHLGGNAFSYIVNNNPAQNLNVTFHTFNNGVRCKDNQFRATTRLRWQINPSSPHLFVSSGWKDKDCATDWEPPEI